MFSWQYWTKYLLKWTIFFSQCIHVYIGTSGIVKQVGGCAANSIAIKSFNLFRFSSKRRVSAAARGSKKRLLASITRERTAAAAMLDQKDTWQRLYFRWPLSTSYHCTHPQPPAMHRQDFNRLKSRCGELWGGSILHPHLQPYLSSKSSVWSTECK